MRSEGTGRAGMEKKVHVLRVHLNCPGSSKKPFFCGNKKKTQTVPPPTCKAKREAKPSESVREMMTLIHSQRDDATPRHDTSSA